MAAAWRTRIILQVVVIIILVVVQELMVVALEQMVAVPTTPVAVPTTRILARLIPATTVTLIYRKEYE